MEKISLDPYEQQLLSVFNKYDHENVGSLDKYGLTQLCQTLQLEDHAPELTKCLLKDTKTSRATFFEFKDALLTLLGNMQHKDDKKPIEKGSPDREVSPKFVYGSKKYGRRSRPKIEDVSDEQNDLNFLNKSPTSAVQRSNSQTEVSSKKRKTNYRLKRCTSLPSREGGRLQNFVPDILDSDEFVCTEDMLREAWKRLGVGEDGYLNQNELVLVCDAIGLSKLAEGVIRQLSDKSALKYDSRISFQELLEALRQDETWSGVINSSEVITSSDSLFPDSRTFQYVTLGPDGSGKISADSIIEIWENIGITAPKELLHELGFDSRQINISDLAVVIDKELKGIQSTNGDGVFNSPQLTLLQASLSLYQSEIRCLKTVLEQMNAEREKLRCDINEANTRATLLAQEVDDNHQKMEENTQNQVRLLEQRHADIIKDLSEQFSSEKDDILLVNKSLEQKIESLELEIAKLKNDLDTAQKYSVTVKEENQFLTGQLDELKQAKDLLDNQVAVLESECHKYNELEHEQIQPLLAKLSDLEMENGQLRDRSDEMVSEIESLTSQIAAMRCRVASTPTFNTLDQSMEESVSVIGEGTGLGSKRRNEYSPSKDVTFLNITDGSPRLGKMRKMPKNPDERFASSESGFDTEIDQLDSSLSSIAETKEITRLRAKVAFLEQILAQHSIPTPAYDDAESDHNNYFTEDVDELKQRVAQLESILSDFKKEVRKMVSKNNITCDSLRYINDKLQNFDVNQSVDITKDAESILIDASTMTDKPDDDLEEKIRLQEEENKELEGKCAELENCVELLKNEYEKCEDYWSKKLDEERQIFEQEQAQNSEQLVDLINKMAEYEEQFAQQDAVDSRLPPIAETSDLEKQFEDLEQEYEEYTLQTEHVIYCKDEEIALLKRKLTELAQKRNRADAGIQVDELSEASIIRHKMGQLTSHIVENTNLTSGEAGEFWTLQENLGDTQEQRLWRKDADSVPSSCSLPNDWCKERQVGNPSPSFSSTPCRPKRTRKHDRNLYKKNVGHEGKEARSNEELNRSDWSGEQTVVLPVSSLRNLDARRHHLEQRCRHLQMVVKQQHFLTEQTLQQYWQKQQGEKAELQCMLKHKQEKLEQQMRAQGEMLEKLARTDHLVKELYVENSYLIANVQRLEQQCHILAARCNTNNSM